MNLNVDEWKEFNVSRTINHPGLLSIEQCKCGCAGDLIEGNDVYYIGAKKSDNGIMKKVQLEPSLVSMGNGIIIICDGQGSVGYTNYIKENFIGSTTISIGYDTRINEKNAMFIVSCLDLDRYKYSYGRKYRPSMNSAIIKLPIQYNDNGSIYIDKGKTYSNEGYVPDFEFMEKYIKSLHHKPITTKVTGNEIPELNVEEWEEFRVGTLFYEIYKAKPHTKDEVTESNKGIHFVSRTDENNGIDLIVKKDSFDGVEEKNCITIGDTTATCYYQDKEFITGDHMVVLRATWLNKYRGLFMRTLFSKESNRYSYGRAYKIDLIKQTVFKLPIKHDEKGNPIIDKDKKYSEKGYIPDWQFMENYIKSLPYSDRI